MKDVLTKKEQDIFSHLNSEVARKLSKIFSTLLGRTAHFEFKGASYFSLEDIPSQFQGEFLCIRYKLDYGNFAGGALVIPKKISILLSELSLGKDGKSLPQDLSPQQVEVCSQMFKKVFEAQGAALSHLIDKKINITLDESKLALPSDVLKEINGKDMWVVAQYSFAIEGFFEDTIYDVVPLSVARVIIEAAAVKISSAGGRVGAWNLEEFGKSKGAGSIKDISFLLDTPLHLTVELGRTKMALKDIMELGVGSIVELDKLAGEPVDIKVNNKLLAKGEVVVIDDNFGVRIVNIVKPNERL